MKSPTKVNELYSSKQVAKILERTPYCIWYHAVNNLKNPIMVGGRLYMTREQMLELLEEGHLRMKPGESKEGLLDRIAASKP